MTVALHDPPWTIAPSRRRTVRGWVLVLLLLWLLWPAAHGGRLGLVVVDGNSMQPTYLPGDVVLTWPTSVEVGDVVLLRAPEGDPSARRLVIHRIHDRDAGGWITKGDNSSSVDGWRLGDRDVLGVAVGRVPALGSLLRRILDPVVVGGMVALACVSWLWPAKDPEHPARDDRDGRQPEPEGSDAAALDAMLAAVLAAEVFDGQAAGVFDGADVDGAETASAPGDARLAVHVRGPREDVRVRRKRDRAVRRALCHQRWLDRRQVLERRRTHLVRNAL